MSPDKPLSARQARKKRPDLLDRALDAFLAEEGFDPERETVLHEEVRKQFLAVRYHFDRIGRRERVQARQAYDIELARRVRTSVDIPKRIGIRPQAKGVVVRGINHFTECVVANYPERPDEDCSCWDESPDL